MTVVAMLGAALATEGIGIHAIFGAFLLGTVIPHDSRLAHAIGTRFGDPVTILLLPAFFAFTGMRTQIDLVSGSDWLVVALIIGTATAGKFGGSLLGARVSGLDWRGAAALGILMNTRGLMELIVLNVGLDLGVISPTLYTMMVLMALATTMATTPILTRVLARSQAVAPASFDASERSC
jgi:Kef-type K+ transport system membrane component KefB